MKFSSDFYQAESNSLNSFGNLYVCEFESLQAAAYQGDLGTAESHERGKRFGTETYADAKEMALNGWEQGVENLAEIEYELDQNLSYGKEEYQWDLQGRQLNVGRFLQGRPDCWLNPVESEEAGGRFISILVSASYNAMIKEEAIKNRGAAIVSLIDHLEHSGYRVKLDVCDPTKNGKDDLIFYRINLKNYDEPVDLSTVAFATAHPAMQRRIMFGVYESLPSNLADMFGAFAGKGKMAPIGDVHASGLSKQISDWDYNIEMTTDNTMNKTFKDIEASQKWVQKQIDLITETETE